jgi:hypothetical protein
MRPRLTHLLLPITALALSSCSGYVYFSKPQPAKVKKLHSFPESWRGTYVTGEDTMMIEKKKINTVSHSIAKYATNDEAAKKIKDDIDTHPKEHESKYTIKGDTMFVDTHHTDSDKLSRRNVLKPFGDRLALNQRSTSGDWWNTVIAEKKSDGLTTYIAHMDSKYFSNPPGTNDSLALYSRITPVKPLDNDYSNTCFICDPNPDQLQQLFDKGLFKVLDAYRKVK